MQKWIWKYIQIKNRVQPSPIFLADETQFKQRFGPTQFSRPGGLSSILRSTSTCRVFSKRKEKKNSTCRRRPPPAPLRPAPGWTTPHGVASSRGGRRASQRLRVRHADGGGGGAGPPGPSTALLPRAPPRPPQVQHQGPRLPGHPPRPRPRGERKGPHPPLTLYAPAGTRRKYGGNMEAKATETAPVWIRCLCSVQVLKELTDRELHVFDMFEDEEYVKTTVEVSLAVSTLQLYLHHLILIDCPCLPRIVLNFWTLVAQMVNGFIFNDEKRWSGGFAGCTGEITRLRVHMGQRAWSWPVRGMGFWGLTECHRMMFVFVSVIVWWFDLYWCLGFWSVGVEEGAFEGLPRDDSGIHAGTRAILNTSPLVCN